ncbi:MAG TPA: hypothetical protein VLJ38_17765 [Polyangiaceae bacterium]|nr:hypothetical protein [Polyangiaceae bacterium]
MDADLMLAELTQVAESVGIEVRSRTLRHLPSLGGLCRMPGRTLVLLSSRATPHERCTVLAQALAELGHSAHPGLGTAARALVERHGRPAPSNTPTEHTTPKKGPGLAGIGERGRRRM